MECELVSARADETRINAKFTDLTKYELRTAIISETVSL